MAIGKKLLGWDYLRALAPRLYASSQRFRTTILLLTMVNVLFFLRLVFHNHWLPFLLFNIMSILTVLSYVFYRVSMYLYDRRQREGEKSSLGVLNDVIRTIKSVLEGFLEYGNIGSLMRVYVGAFAMEMLFDLLSPFAFLLTVLDLEWILENTGLPQIQNTVNNVKQRVKQAWEQVWIKLPRYNPNRVQAGIGSLNGSKTLNLPTGIASGQSLPSPTFPVQNIKELGNQYGSTINKDRIYPIPRASIQKQEAKFDINPPASNLIYRPTQSIPLASQPISAPVTHSVSYPPPARDFQNVMPNESFTSYRTAQASVSPATTYPMGLSKSYSSALAAPLYQVPGIPSLRSPPLPVPIDASFETIPKNETWENSAQLSFRSIPMATPQEQLQRLKSPLNLHF